MMGCDCSVLRALGSQPLTLPLICTMASGEDISVVAYR